MTPDPMLVDGLPVEAVLLHDGREVAGPVPATTDATAEFDAVGRGVWYNGADVRVDGRTVWSEPVRLGIGDGNLVVLTGIDAAIAIARTRGDLA